MSIYDTLDRFGISYQRFDHPAVFTCEQANALTTQIPGAKLKNLFLRNKKGDRHFLIALPDTKRVDLGALGKVLGAGNLSMGSAERLKKYLGIEPGAVSLLALVNDATCSVEIVADESIWSAGAIQCHPLVNTSTLVLARDAVEAFFLGLGRKVTVLSVPAEGA